jgi:hypothetical protein
LVSVSPVRLDQSAGTLDGRLTVRRSPLASRQIRVGSACAVAAGALAAFPLAAAARPEHAGPRATTTAATGTVYGGTTAQGFPIVLETSKNGRKVLRATVAIRFTCTSGGAFTVPDTYMRLVVSKQRKFGASFGPETMRNDDGTTTDFEGSMAGAFNKARTKASGTWTITATDHDGSGAVTDTCETGRVGWSAKQ